MTAEIKKQINDCMYRHTIAKTPAAKNRLMRLAEELEYLAYVQDINNQQPATNAVPLKARKMWA